ncbi:magnesium transporter CorA family protein [Heyndrickxia sp. MSNUG]|uniref:magnesium transporter CorA family protein n=1 Tax=Heyndrickxia sp. MSNUG TaxID=3136677 RepID=UPI003C2CBA1A
MLHYDVTSKNVKKEQAYTLPSSSSDTIWIHFDPSNKDRFDEFISKMDIHPLAKKGLEQFSDIPKIDVFNNEAIISLFAIQDDYTQAKITILIGENYVITKEEENIDLLAQLKQLFFEHPEQMETSGKVLYHIFDKVSSIDLKMVDRIADNIQKLERNVFDRPFENEIPRSIHRWKSSLHELRQTIEAQDQVMTTISRKELKFVDEDSALYFKDLNNSYARVVNALDSFKESLDSIFNLQMTLKSDHANSIMKTLTLVSAIFLPMTFIAGMYGMNFESMPELKWRFGYGYALFLMFGIGAAIALFFRAKGWWGNKN